MSKSISRQEKGHFDAKVSWMILHVGVLYVQHQYPEFWWPKGKCVKYCEPSLLANLLNLVDCGFAALTNEMDD